MLHTPLPPQGFNPSSINKMKQRSTIQFGEMNDNQCTVTTGKIRSSSNFNRTNVILNDETPSEYTETDAKNEEKLIRQQKANQYKQMLEDDQNRRRMTEEQPNQLGNLTKKGYERQQTDQEDEGFVIGNYKDKDTQRRLKVEAARNYRDQLEADRQDINQTTSQIAPNGGYTGNSAQNSGRGMPFTQDPEGFLPIGESVSETKQRQIELRRQYKAQLDADKGDKSGRDINDEGVYTSFPPIKTNSFKGESTGRKHPQSQGGGLNLGRYDSTVQTAAQQRDADNINKQRKQAEYRRLLEEQADADRQIKQSNAEPLEDRRGGPLPYMKY